MKAKTENGDVIKVLKKRTRGYGKLSCNPGAGRLTRPRCSPISNSSSHLSVGFQNGYVVFFYKRNKDLISISESNILDSRPFNYPG